MRLESVGFKPLNGGFRKVINQPLSFHELEVDFTDFAHKYKDEEQGQLLGEANDGTPAILQWSYLRNHQYGFELEENRLIELPPGYESVGIAGLFRLNGDPSFEFRYQLQGNQGKLIPFNVQPFSDAEVRLLSQLAVLGDSQLREIVCSYHNIS